MEKCFVLCREFTDTLKVEQISNFIVGMHERHQGIGILFQEFLKMGHADVSLFIEVYRMQLNHSLFFQYFQGMRHRMVLNRRRDSVFDSVGLNATDDECIVSLCAPGRENDFPWSAVEQLCYFLQIGRASCRERV